MNDEVMTPEEFAKKVREAFSGPGDAENWHAEADYVMCELLRQLGYGKGVDIFEAGQKWYA